MQTSPWRAQILTLYPEMFPGPLGHSLAGRALEAGLWALEALNIRDYALNKHRNVDDTPAGGGPGMVMRPDVLGLAVDEALKRRPGAAEAAAAPSPAKNRAAENWAAENWTAEDWPVLYLSPRGRTFDQAMARDLAGKKGLTLICGRFEGVDERVLQARRIYEVSLGDFVLSGGEPAALVLMDAVVRLLPGVVGAPETLAEESFESGLLEYPHYTRPKVWEGLEIPEILQSGHHGRIRDWRRAEAEKITRERRPDLWEKYVRKK